VYQTAEHALMRHNYFGGSLNHHIFYNRKTNQWYTGKMLDCAVQQLVSGQFPTVDMSEHTLFRFVPFSMAMTAGELDNWHMVLLSYPQKLSFIFVAMTFNFSDCNVYEMFKAIDKLEYV
jgi:hypothetical protein